MDLLRDVYCGSCLIYLPQGRGGGDRGKKSQDYCYAVKRGEEASIAKIAAHIGRHRNKYGIHGVLGEDVVLVPMPRSAPFTQGALWPARMLAEALVGERLGLFVLLDAGASRRSPEVFHRRAGKATESRCSSEVLSGLATRGPAQSDRDRGRCRHQRDDNARGDFGSLRRDSRCPAKGVRIFSHAIHGGA